MQSRFARILVLLAAVQILGGHWAVLQSVAWVKMVIDYSQNDSLPVAIEKTFDGKHPCAICLTIEGAEKQQKQQEAAQPAPEIKGVLAPVVQVAGPTFVLVEWPLLTESAVPLVHTPPVPPPRAA